MDGISGISRLNAESGKIQRMPGNAGKSPGIDTTDVFTPDAAFYHTDDKLKRAADLLAKGNIAERMKGCVWDFETGNRMPILSTPVMLDKEHLVFRDAVNLYSINPKNGDKNWELGVGVWNSKQPERGKGSLIYTRVNSDKNEAMLCAVDYRTGKKIWDKPLDEENRGYVAGSDGNIYIGSDRKNLIALDGATGEKLWEAPNDKCTSVLGTNNKGLVFFQRGNVKTIALDEKTGEKKWEHDADSSYQVIQEICPDGDIAVSTSKGLELIDGATGKLKWTNRNGIISTGLVFDDDGNIYLGTREKEGGTIRKLSVKDGKELWQQETPKEIRATPALYKGTLFVGDSSGILHSIDSKTGKLNWKEKTGELSLAISQSIIPMNDGTVFVGHAHDSICSKWSHDFAKIDMSDGTIIRQFQCPSEAYVSHPNINFDKSKYDFIGPVALSASSEETGVIYVGTDKGKLVALGKPSDITAHVMREEESNEDKKVVVKEKSVEIGGVKLDVRQYNFLNPFGP